MANKSSAVADEPIEVLFALHHKFDLMDFAGPLEVLTTAQHDAKDPSELPLFASPAPPPVNPIQRGDGADIHTISAQWLPSSPCEAIMLYKC